jgi:diguanylate cyclase (GGDEF)-like protein/PAS domain S-box-containing protein
MDDNDKGIRNNGEQEKLKASEVRYQEQRDLLAENQVDQEKLHTSEVRYRRLFETAKDGILLLDADTGRITDVNPFLEDLLGYSHSELIGKALWEIGPVKDITASQDAMRRLQNNEYIRYENLPLETKAGQQIQVEFVSNVYLVDGWRVIQCNVRDITARKRAEEGMRTANDELRASVAELQRRDEEMKSLIRLNDLLQSCTTQAEAYQVVGLLANELFAGDSGGLAISRGPNQQSETVVRWGNESPLKSSFSLEDCWAIRRGQLHEVSDSGVDLLCHHFVHQPQARYLCVPLIVQSGTTGLLCLTGAAGKVIGSITRQQLAVAAGETIKLSLYNLKLREELREQATHDPLTGLCNRRFLEENLARELHRARRGNSPLCVVMLDLDNFKPFNDTFGHEAGDSMLRELGQMLREKLRKSDIACRYGGDEFVLVLPDSSLADAQRRVEQIRALVKERQIRHGCSVLGAISVSAGVAGAPEHGSTTAELLQVADNAMYAAKQAGRDCVVVYQAKESQIENSRRDSLNFRPAPTG